MKIIFLGFFVITGLFTFAIFDEVNALSEKGAEQGKAKGCEKDNPNQAKNNPHCVVSGCDVKGDPTGDCDGDTIPNIDDICPDTPIFRVGDHDGDGQGDAIDADPCDPSVK